MQEKRARIALATNPIFPKTATMSRIKWAGLSSEDFEYCSTYENSHYSKPNIKYYDEILQKMEIKAEEVLRVGNDVQDDMVVRNIGASAFLLTDCLINKSNIDISAYPNGNFDALIEYINKL